MLLYTICQNMIQTWSKLPAFKQEIDKENKIDTDEEEEISEKNIINSLESQDMN